MPPTFYIIDGHAQIYRSYFAPFRQLTSPSGEPTKATYVFTQMLLNLIEQKKPDYLAMVIDVDEGAVFRRELYPEYKANRPPAPPDFEPQEKRILELVRDAGLPVFGQPGFEADDVIATMTQRLRGRGFQVVLVSKDKDLRQLLDDHTVMYDVSSDKFLDAAAIASTYGYRPDQAIEVQTLVGDATDNVPGIPGVGEKTAAKLITQYANVDGVLQHLDELTPKMRENFEKFAERLKLSRQLVTLRQDVEMDFSPEACRFQGLNAVGLRRHLQDLGFRGLLERLDGPAPARRPPPKPKKEIEPGLFGEVESQKSEVTSQGPEPLTSAEAHYILVDTQERFQAFLADLRAQKRFAFDTETDALGAMRSNLVGMSFSWREGTGYYLPVRGPADSAHLDAPATLAALRPILEDPAIKKVGHNIKYDLLVMRCAGVNLRGIELDSMVATFLVDASRTSYGIDRLAYELLNFQKIPTSDLIGQGKNQTSMDRVPPEKVAIYAAEDADIALRLCDLMGRRLTAAPALKKLADELETPLIDVLAEMEFNGVAIDPEMLRQQSQVLGDRAQELRRQIMETAGVEFNPDSPKQLGDVLFNRLGLKVIKRNKTGPSTDVEVLEKLAAEHKTPRLVLEYRSLTKLKNTYLDNLTDFVNPRTGRIHGSFNQTGAATGRLSMSDPNLQNIPIRSDEGRRIRLAFVPGDMAHNVLLTADYSQVELRILAHYTREPALVRAFDADEDVHRAVAAEVFGVSPQDVTRQQRADAKVINFGIIYGISAWGLARQIEGLGVTAAQELIYSYNRRFPSIEKFLEQCVAQARTHGFVETLLGRRRPLPDIDSAVIQQRNAAERMAINSVVQGSAADLIKIAMLRIHRRLKSEGRPSRMLLQVHDELVFETPESAVEGEARMIQDEMAGAMDLAVPLKVDVGWGKNWQEGK